MMGILDDNQSPTLGENLPLDCEINFPRILRFASIICPGKRKIANAKLSVHPSLPAVSKSGNKRPLTQTANRRTEVDMYGPQIKKNNVRARERQQKGNEKEESPDILIHAAIDERISDIRRTDSSENLFPTDGTCTGGTERKHDGTSFTHAARYTHQRNVGHAAPELIYLS
jgi:hypothetical protein